MTELKPCPFCGGEAEIVKDKRWPRSLDHSIDAWHVECTNFDCVIYQVDNNYYRKRKEAVEMWNRRIE
jgi:hypothetical protein